MGKIKVSKSRTRARSDQRSPHQRLRLPRNTVPLLALKERLGQDPGSRGRRRKAVQTAVILALNMQRERLPIQGIRSQVKTGIIIRKRREELPYGSPLREIAGTKSICTQRGQRRRRLFSMAIAGKNRRRSPGRGGHYKRTEDSQLHCRTVR